MLTKRFNSLRVVCAGNLIMALTCASLGRTWPWPTCRPWYVTVPFPNSHFTKFSVKTHAQHEWTPQWVYQCAQTRWTSIHGSRINRRCSCSLLPEQFQPTSGTWRACYTFRRPLQCIVKNNLGWQRQRFRRNVPWGALASIPLRDQACHELGRPYIIHTVLHMRGRVWVKPCDRVYFLKVCNKSWYAIRLSFQKAERTLCTGAGFC